MKLPFTFWLAFLFLLIGGFIPVHAERISWDDLPAPVKKSAHTHSGKFSHVEKLLQNGEVVYQLEGQSKQGSVELEFAPDGQLLYAAKEKELAELPETMQSAIKKHSVGEQLDGILKIIEDGESSYELDLTKNGTEHTLVLDDAGNVLRDQMEVSLDQIPAPAQKTIHSEAGAAKIESIVKVIEDGETTFEVEVAKNERTVEIDVAANGDLLGMEMTLVETPTAVQQGIKKALQDAKLDEIYKTSEEGEVCYDATLSRNGRAII